MKYIKLSIIPILLLIAILMSCEKDDICAEETQTTPQLIIRFYDVNDSDETKIVSGLFAYRSIDEMNTIVEFEGLTTASSIDSIAIPLPLEANTTSFILHQDFEIDDNDTPENDADDTILGNPDTITVTYERENVYVSRACGFKTVFNNITFSFASDTENWIANSEIIIDNIENQNAAHVKVFH